MTVGTQEALLDPAAAAQVYLRLPPDDQQRVVAFVGSGRLSAIFARLPVEMRGAIANTLTSDAADVFREPLTAIPLAPEDEALHAALLGELVCAVARRRGG